VIIVKTHKGKWLFGITLLAVCLNAGAAVVGVPILNGNGMSYPDTTTFDHIGLVGQKPPKFRATANLRLTDQTCHFSNTVFAS